jgi:hypothetical protein
MFTPRSRDPARNEFWSYFKHLPHGGGGTSEDPNVQVRNTFRVLGSAEVLSYEFNERHVLPQALVFGLVPVPRLGFPFDQVGDKEW